MTLEHQTDIAPRGLLHLAPPFWGKPRMAAILLSIFEELQELEDAVWTVIDQIDVDVAPYFVLDLLAKIVGEERRPPTADGLRALIKGRILANRSSGTIPDIEDLCKALFASTDRIQQIDLDVTVFISDAGVSDPDYCDLLLDDAAAGTISTALITSGTFALYDYNNPATLPGFDGGTLGDRHGLD